MRRWFEIGALVGTLALCACRDHKSADDLAALEGKQREHEQRLARLQQQIAEAERAVEDARRRAERERCRADAASIDAATMVRAAECMREVASASQCAAEAAKAKGESAVGGCLLGIVAAYVSGGALSELALTGCAAGQIHGELTAPSCPRPACVSEASRWILDAAKSRGHVGLPICEIGIELVEVPRTSTGFLLEGSFGGASRAGLRRGDVIVGVNGQAVENRETLAQALESVRVGAAVPVEYVRNGAAGRTTVKTTDRDDAGSKLDRTLLGVTSDNSGANIPAVDHVAVAIAVVAPDSAAAASGLQRGELIQGVGDGTPLRASALADLLRRQPDEPIRLLVTNHGKARVITVHPMSSSERAHP